MAETINAETFIERLTNGNKGALLGRQVRGNVSLRGRRFDASLRALDVTFWGEVDLSDCRFERSLDLAGCKFAKTLTLQHSHVGGSLDLSRLRVRTEGSATAAALPGTISLDLRGMRIGGNLSLMRTEVDYGTSADESAERGGIQASGIQVGGQTDLRSIKTDNSVNFSGARFVGDVQFGQDDVKDARDSTASVGKKLEFQNCRFESNFALIGGEIGTDLNLWASQCDGVVFLRAAALGTTFEEGFSPFSVHGTANLANVRYAYLDVDGLTVSDSLRIFAADIGQLRIYLGQSQTPTSVGRFELEDTRFSGRVDLSGLHVTGSFLGAKAQGASLRNLTVGGAITFWSPLAPFDTDSGSRWPHARDTDKNRAIVNGDLQISGCTIGSALDLTNVLCFGRIHLDDTRVTGDVEMRSTLTGRDLLERAELIVSTAERDAVHAGKVADRARQCERIEAAEAAGEMSGEEVEAALAKLGPQPQPAPRPQLRTLAVALSMNNLACDNDVDLTGLEITMSDPNRVGSRRTLTIPSAGHIDAQNVTVGRTLRLFEGCEDRDLCSEVTHRGEGISVPGAIDLSGAAIGELKMSRHSFSPVLPSDRARDVGIVLSGANINEVSIEDLSRASRRELDLPRPIDLRDIRVGQWNIYDRKRPLLPRHLTYKSLANTDDTFRRRTWLALERSLRDQGHSTDADRLYIAMERRDEAESWRDARIGAAAPFMLLLTGLKWLFFRKPFDGFLGYGTKPLRLLTCIVALWLIALPFYQTASNFEPSLDMLGAEATSFRLGAIKPLAEMPPSEWSRVSGLVYSLRHHVPVIALTPRDEWTLRDTGDTCTGTYWWLQDDDTTQSDAEVTSSRDGTATCEGVVLPGSPENWGTLATILNFIAWPFVLAFAINRFLRIGRD